MRAKALESCPTLCDPKDCSPPGSSVHGFSRQEYWSGLPFPTPGVLPNPGIRPVSLVSPALAGRFLSLAPPGKSFSRKVKVLVAQLNPTLCDPMDYSPPGFSVPGIFQARILEWGAIPFSRGPSCPRDQTQVSCIAGGFFTTEPPGKPMPQPLITSNLLSVSVNSPILGTSYKRNHTISVLCFIKNFTKGFSSYGKITIVGDEAMHGILNRK